MTLASMAMYVREQRSDQPAACVCNQVLYDLMLESHYNDAGDYSVDDEDFRWEGSYDA